MINMSCTGDLVVREDIMKTIAVDADGIFYLIVKHQNESSEVITLDKILELTQNKLTKNNKGLAISLTVIAEEPNSGRIFRWNNYGKGEWMVVGCTCGYA